MLDAAVQIVDENKSFRYSLHPSVKLTPLGSMSSKAL